MNIKERNALLLYTIHTKIEPVIALWDVQKNVNRLQELIKVKNENHILYFSIYLRNQWY